MKRLAMAALICCSAPVAFQSLRGPAVAGGEAQVAPQRWEYRFYAGDPLLTEEFDKLGAQGWEVCGVYPGETIHQHVTAFKRPKR